MYFAILVLLYIYVIISMVLTAWYFSSWELLFRFFILALPFVGTIMLSLRDFRKKGDSYYAKSSSFLLLFFCVVFTISIFQALEYGSADFYLNHLPTFDSVLDNILSSLKKALSNLGIKFE